MSLGLVKRNIVLGLAAGLCCLPLGGVTEAAPRTGAYQVQDRGTAIIVVRVWKDGSPCRGTARLRPLKGGKIDMSRFVTIGYVTTADTKSHVDAVGEFFTKGITLQDIMSGAKRSKISSYRSHLDRM